MNSHRSVEELARDLLDKSFSDLDPQERNVIESIHLRNIVSQDAGDKADDQSTFGQRLSDKVAAVGGSWPFIIVFVMVLLGWMILNSEMLAKFDEAFDPYPYIFLNLMLSTMAAIQAPIIMMSQNRASEKDRIAARHDYEVNLRAELEIMRLHDRIDLMSQQIHMMQEHLRETK